MAMYTEEDCERFLIELTKHSLKGFIVRIIKKEIDERLNGYGFYTDPESRINDCISDALGFNTEQMVLPLSKSAIDKLDRWNDKGNYYLTNHWRSIAISFSQRKAREWENKGDQSSGRIDSELVTENHTHEVYYSFDIERENFKSLVGEKQSQAQIQSYHDRLDGLTFVEMMKKYEPENLHKDKKGQKYRRRFDRLVDKLGIKDSVQKFIKKTERVV